MAAFASLPVRAAVLDGELCLIDATGLSNFCELHTRWPGENDLVFMAFDFLRRG